MKSAESQSSRQRETGCAKTPKWRFGRTKKGFSDPSPPKKTRHIETVEVVFPGSPAGEEFSHSLVRRRSVPSKCAPSRSASSRRRLREIVLWVDWNLKPA